MEDLMITLKALGRGNCFPLHCIYLQLDSLKPQEELRLPYKGRGYYNYVRDS